jgi:hypothetical protein
MKGVQGGFYFHPSDKDLSLGTPERKKLLELWVPVKTRIENAVAEIPNKQRMISLSAPSSPRWVEECIIAEALVERYRQKNLQASGLRAADRWPENAVRPMPQTPASSDETVYHGRAMEFSLNRSLRLLAPLAPLALLACFGRPSTSAQTRPEPNSQLASRELTTRVHYAAQQAKVQAQNPGRSGWFAIEMAQ